MTSESPLAVTLERLAQGAARPADNVETLKTVVARVHSRLKMQDIEVRYETLAMIASPERQTLVHLVRTVELCRDPPLVGSVCALLHDALCPSNKGDVRHIIIQTCLSLNTAEVILRTLKALSADGLSAIESCTHSAYQVLAKLASKDLRLAVKARLVGGVKLTHQLLQAHMKNSIPLLPLLMVTKYLAKNSINQVMLGKDGCVATMASILSSVPKTHWAKIKFIMEILSLLTKVTNVSPRLAAIVRANGQKLQALLNYFFESNVIRLVRESGLQRVLAILDAWEKIERRHQVKVIKAILGTLSHVCDSKHGRKAVITLNGVEIAQRFIQTCPADKKYDGSLASATNVFLKCASKGELPVSSIRMIYLPSAK
ncbi:uncharacterized protein LOC121859437 isoform X1 [Homarus americanus]|uniref:uncharacterized protein LOC121859437 isoform X1 n=1 Tax=Homarus americanus TaxID=6706 RepID=UPI001C4699E5|nr:uncharacterized protein LOC121859437 isoform X1 [Homarus americanus]